LSVYSQAELNKVALRLIQRLRKTLGFETPELRLRANVATTRRDRPGDQDLGVKARSLLKLAVHWREKLD